MEANSIFVGFRGLRNALSLSYCSVSVSSPSPRSVGAIIVLSPDGLRPQLSLELHGLFFREAVSLLVSFRSAIGFGESLRYLLAMSVVWGLYSVVCDL